MLKVGINGFGRIGRCVVRALHEHGFRDRIEIVAINDLSDSAHSGHLLRFDSVHGRFNEPVSVDGDHLRVGADSIQLLRQPDPALLPWGDLGVDVVFECTGRFTSKAKCLPHLAAGARQVLVSAPCTEADATVVFGVNEASLRPGQQVVSNASCTTNCLAPVAQVLHRHFGIEAGTMTTIHSYTNDQHILDLAHPKDMYRGRAAALSMIPTATGAAKAIGLVLPELEGRLAGMAVRVPTPNVSLVDLTVQVTKPVTREAVNEAMRAAANASKVLRYVDSPLVSVDFNHDPASSSFDSNHTLVKGQMVKVMAWYDNEWGFSCRMLDTALAMTGS